MAAEALFKEVELVGCTARYALQGDEWVLLNVESHAEGRHQSALDNIKKYYGTRGWRERTNYNWVQASHGVLEDRHFEKRRPGRVDTYLNSVARTQQRFITVALHEPITTVVDESVPVAWPETYTVEVPHRTYVRSMINEIYKIACTGSLVLFIVHHVAHGRDLLRAFGPRIRRSFAGQQIDDYIIIRALKDPQLKRHDESTWRAYGFPMLPTFIESYAAQIIAQRDANG
jgi:hypothetical protein